MGQHIEGDVFEAIYSQDWDMMIAHPPCTHLSVSGAAHFAQKRKDGRQQSAIDFFMRIINAPIHKICVENPVCIMSKIYRKPDQIIQPYQFGHDMSKSTCLWLKNLVKLVPTDFVQPTKFFCKDCKTMFKRELGDLCPICGGVRLLPRYANQTPQGQDKRGPSPDRAKNRAKTCEGIAQAMADRWG